MPIAKEELQERAQLIRVWEASCSIEYPTSDELNFRIAVAKKLAETFNLRCLKTSVITGPVLQTPPRPQPQPQRR